MYLDPLLPSLHCSFLSPSDFISISVRSLSSVICVCVCVCVCVRCVVRSLSWGVGWVCVCVCVCVCVTLPRNVRRMRLPYDLTVCRAGVNAVRHRNRKLFVSLWIRAAQTLWLP